MKFTKCNIAFPVQRSWCYGTLSTAQSYLSYIDWPHSRSCRTSIDRTAVMMRMRNKNNPQFFSQSILFQTRIDEHVYVFLMSRGRQDQNEYLYRFVCRIY